MNRRCYSLYNEEKNAEYIFIHYLDGNIIKKKKLKHSRKINNSNNQPQRRNPTQSLIKMNNIEDIFNDRNENDTYFLKKKRSEPIMVHDKDKKISNKCNDYKIEK